MRLATLAEPICDALSEGGITLDIAKAYASTENQAKQLHVWEAYGGNYSNADTIRRVIASQTMKSTDGVAIFVGEERCVAARGQKAPHQFRRGGDKWGDTEITQRVGGEIQDGKRGGE